MSQAIKVQIIRSLRDLGMY